MKQSVLAVIISASAMLVLRCGASAQTSYAATDLGTLGGTSASPSGVNDAGQVVGSSTLANGAAHGFVWPSAAGKMIDIGTLTGNPADPSSANGINNLGDVAATSMATGGVYHACLWSNGTLTDLNSPDLLSPTDFANWVLTRADKINGNRQVIGFGTIKLNGTAVGHGYLLDLTTAPATITDLGAWAPRGINNLSPAWVAGDNSGNCYVYQGSSQVVSILPPFPPPTTSTLTAVRGISNAGEVVGYAYSGHAAYRDPAGNITDLGVSGAANCINNASSALVVGTVNGPVIGCTATHSAFRWFVGTSPTTVQDLGKITTGLAKGTTLTGAASVSDTGYIACGANYTSGKTSYAHAILLTPH